MLVLPRGIAVYENVEAAQYEGPAILRLLKESQHTGFARFHFFQSVAHLLFAGGNLVHVSLETREGVLAGLEGLKSLFELIIHEGGRLDVYRLSPALMRHVLGFLRGTRLHEAQALKLIDRKALVDGIRREKLSGALHVYTAERSAMIFYDGGVPLGFFQDGAEELGVSAADFQLIASMPDAMVDVTRTAPVGDGLLPEILEMDVVESTWKACVDTHKKSREEFDQSAAVKQRASREATVAALEQALMEIAGTYLGKIGRTLAEKEIAGRGGPALLQDPAASAAFLAAMEKGAKLLTSTSKTRGMIEAMRAELSGWTETTGN
jgi:hypothetical protein